MKNQEWHVAALALAQRFEPVRLLGEGGYGVVFEVFDRERGERVALKRLHRSTPSALAAFKSEFRLLSGLTHPSLPELHELFVEGGEGSFSMQLVGGYGLREWVGIPPQVVRSETGTATLSGAFPVLDGVAGAPLPGPSSIDATTVARVRAVVRELLDVLAFVHRSGLVHCDVKPSNVRVTPEGRVVLLDFGLARPLRRAAGAFAGTPAYAAPEQLAGTVTPACDLYAVGALAWELLVGHAPFGTGVEAAENKQRRDPPSLRGLLPPGDDDLAGLVAALLSRDPRAREVAVGRSHPEVVRESFVGRADVLAAVDAAVDELAFGAPVVLVLEGASGIGKTTLLHAIERRLSAHPRGLTVLSARAAQGEHLPFKMLDGIADGLAPLRTAEVAHAYDVLGRAFPVLRGASTAPRAVEPDLEGDMASALRTVLGALGRSVLVLDDAQWADGDSERVLRAALAPPGAPAVLLLLAQRPSSGMDVTRLAAEVQTIVLGPLSPAETRSLVAARDGGGGLDPELVVAESGGHPLFVEELLSVGRGAVPRSLDEALDGRVARLSAGPRQLLAVAALATEALDGRALAALVARDLGTVTRELDALVKGRFLRRVEGPNSVRYSPFHDRLADAIRRALTPADARAIHRAFVDRLGEREMTPEAMCHHFREAGVSSEAARLAGLAADHAREAMAFASEARFCRIALELTPEDPSAARRLRARLADALRRAGRSVEAAEMLTELASDAGEAQALELRTNAARLLIAAGELARGQALLVQALSRYGDRLPPARETQAIAALLLERWALGAALLLYRLTGYRPLPGALDPARLSGLRAFAEGLGMIDNLRAAAFHARAVRLGLRSPDPVLRGEMLALESIFVGSTGRRGRERARELQELALAPFGETVPARVRGFVAAARAVLARNQTPNMKNHDDLRACEAFFEALGEGDAWVIWSLRITRARCARLMGNLVAMRALYYPLVARAEAEQDLYGAVTLRRGHALLHLAADRPARARAELAASRWPSSPTAYHSQDWLLLEAQLETTLYEGAVPAPSALEWKRLRRSALHLADTQRVLHRYMLGRVLLARASALSLSSFEERRALAEVAELARALVRERESHALAKARVLRAGLAFHRGDLDTARAELRALVRTAARSDLVSLGANGSYVLARLVAGPERAEHQVRAREYYRAHGVRNPEAWARIDFPGFAPLLRGGQGPSDTTKSPVSE